MIVHDKFVNKTMIEMRFCAVEMKFVASSALLLYKFDILKDRGLLFHLNAISNDVSNFRSRDVMTSFYPVTARFPAEPAPAVCLKV